ADYNSYRPYLRGKANITNDLSVSLTYRPYYKRNSKNIGTPKQTTEKGYNLTSAIAYKFLNDYTFEYELDYQNSNEEKDNPSENKKYAFSHDFKLSYQWDKNWRPYLAVGNVPAIDKGNDRQTRYRIGVQYSF
ncbi:oligogalacturonate-specific porin KdgM family protein, partial [Candidatus Symbiopectobacterium sp. NZEC135]